jgi:serine/threonine protein kinase
MPTSNLTDWLSAYAKIRFSVRGSSARVFLAVSRTHLTVATAALVSQAEAENEEIITLLCSKIVAVKVSTTAPVRHNGLLKLPKVSSTRTIINFGRLNLDIIHDTISHPRGRKHVVGLVDYDPTLSDPRWIVTETMPSSCNLSILLKHADSPILPALVLWVFVQASPGLLYMQQRSSPISHGDIKLANLLIGFHNEDPGTMPEVKIFDVGYTAENTDAGKLCENGGIPIHGEEMKEKVVVLMELHRAIMYTTEISKQVMKSHVRDAAHMYPVELRCRVDKLDAASVVDVIVALSDRCGVLNSGTIGCNVLDVFRAICRQRRYRDLAQSWAKMGLLAMAKLTTVDSEDCQEIDDLVHLAVLEEYGDIRGQVWRVLLEEVKASVG